MHTTSSIYGCRPRLGCACLLHHEMALSDTIPMPSRGPLTDQATQLWKGGSASEWAAHLDAYPVRPAIVA